MEQGNKFLKQSEYDFAKSEVALRFAKAIQSYTQEAVVQKQICQHLMKLMQAHIQSHDLRSVFEIGCGSGNLTRLLASQFKIEHLFLNDLYPEVRQHFQNVLFEKNIEWCIGDAEKIDFPKSLDLITSSSAFQWMHDLDLVLNQSQKALKDKGYLCFSTFGKQNLQEIKALTGQGLSYYTIEEIQEKLQQHNFEILHISEQCIYLHFEHPKTVLQHLKATGVTATASKHRWTKQSLQQFYEGYVQFSTSDVPAKFRLSYHPIYVIARSLA